MKSKASPVSVSEPFDWSDAPLELPKRTPVVKAGEAPGSSDDTPAVGRRPSGSEGRGLRERISKPDRPKRIRKPSRKLDMASENKTNNNFPINNNNNNNNNNIRCSISDSMNIGDLTLEDERFDDDDFSGSMFASPTASEAGERVLMRQWLINKAEAPEPNGMRWHNTQKTQIRIPWKHGSRAGWTVNDCRVFKAWAEHTGKDHSEPKRWKANFRCALNSLKDVKPLKHLSHKRGSDTFVVYELLPETHRKSSARKIKQNGLYKIKSEPTSPPRTPEAASGHSSPSLFDQTFKSSPLNQSPLQQQQWSAYSFPYQDTVKTESDEQYYSSCGQTPAQELRAAQQQRSPVIPITVMEMDSEDEQADDSEDKPNLSPNYVTPQYDVTDSAYCSPTSSPDSQVSYSLSESQAGEFSFQYTSESLLEYQGCNIQYIPPENLGQFQEYNIQDSDSISDLSIIEGCKLLTDVLYASAENWTQLGDLQELELFSELMSCDVM